MASQVKYHPDNFFADKNLGNPFLPFSTLISKVPPQAYGAITAVGMAANPHEDHQGWILKLQVKNI